MKKLVLQTTPIPISPPVWPDISKGKSLYRNYCMSCHGKNGEGDGSLSTELNPKPTNFWASKMLESSPFQIFNTIRLGVPQTSMKSFDELSDKEVWDLAFYIKALPYEQGKDKELAKKLISRKDLTLKDLAFLSDQDLEALFQDISVDTMTSVAALRNYSRTGKSSSSLSVAARFVNEAELFYEKGDQNAAREKALRAYLEGVEPVELQLKASYPSFMRKLEVDMQAFRSAIDHEQSKTKVRTKAKVALSGIEQAKSILADNKFSFWTTFLLAASVILREGLEAFLILITVLAVIKSVKASWAAKWVHLGWMLAVIVGVFSWFLVDDLINIGGSQREIVEGSISIFAASVLLYLGFWLHQKSEIGKWNSFVKTRVHSLLTGSNLLGIFAFAFIVVFREAFESVLFLSALNLEVEASNQSAIGLGVAGAFVIVLFLSWILLRYTKKFPVIKLLKISTVVIGGLAIVLIGKGVHALQESGFVPITGVNLSWRLDLLGYYPTWETISAQLGVISIILISYWWGHTLFFIKKLIFKRNP
ncbi:FTR1 family protein [Christiangramia flava]|nr:FTR1 family protein [Christiangramia flava]